MRGKHRKRAQLKIAATQKTEAEKLRELIAREEAERAEVLERLRECDELVEEIAALKDELHLVTRDEETFLITEVAELVLLVKAEGTSQQRKRRSRDRNNAFALPGKNGSQNVNVEIIEQLLQEHRSSDSASTITEGVHGKFAREFGPDAVKEIQRARGIR